MFKKSFWLFFLFCLLNLSFQSISAGQVALLGGGETSYLPILRTRGFDIIPTSITFEDITDIVSAGDQRLFIVEREGRIRAISASGAVSTFLDITDRVVSDEAEQGLLAVTFALDYLESGWFYVAYIDEESGSNWMTVSAFQVSEDPNLADKDTEVRLMRVKQDNPIHNGGGLVINPNDGQLYIGVGDDAQSTLAQDTTSTKGKLLRVEITGLDSGQLRPLQPWLDAYSAVATTIWASGLRNPWQVAIHPTNNDMYLGDVGSSIWEEVNYIAGGSAGVNFGWPCLEGPDVRSTDPPCNEPTTYELPIYYYGRDDGCAVIVGEVFKEDRLIFGDFCRRTISSITNVGGSWIVEELGVLPDPAGFITTFGIDTLGQIYVGTTAKPGPIYQLYIP